MRADLHLHSRHGGAAAQWLFRRLGLPGSYSEPHELYEMARARGMDFFTLTDCDTLDGCLSIAEKPGVFLSAAVSTQFPEDRAQVRLLVWGVTEADLAELLRLRGNLYDVQRFLALRKLAHAVAHPLHRVEAGLGVEHVEKLLLLFRHFEGVNGTRNGLSSETMRFIANGLTRAKMEELANRHGFAPTHAEPWRKALVGGSDDRSGLFVANAWTEAHAADASAFLAEVREGRCVAGGRAGTPLGQAHGLYGQVFQFASERLPGLDGEGPVKKAFARFMEGGNPAAFSAGEKLGFVVQGILSGQVFELAGVWRQFASMTRDSKLSERISQATVGIAEPERRAFVIACLLADWLVFESFQSFARKLGGGKVFEAMQDAAMAVPVALSLSPYFIAFRQLAPDRAWLGKVCEALTGAVSPALKCRKRAWFTDTLEDVNGVATTIVQMATAAEQNGDSLTVVTSCDGGSLKGISLVNFPPVGECSLPEYEEQKLRFPPLLQVIDFIQREGFSELIISTPGPMGLAALLAARLLGLRTAGIYHTDFPQFVRFLTEDRSWEAATWAFMRWFYGQMDVVWVNSESYRKLWIERGLAEASLRILPRGIDSARFCPERRSAEFWQKRGVPAGAPVLLYVGRISKEKNLDVIAAAWAALGSTGAALAFVGDGPHRGELARSLPGAVFTGYLGSEELATAFASADVFLFPSTTDTFGNVVLEALASGLPCVVSDVGGPKDLVKDGVTGFITRGLDCAAFAAAVRRLLDEPALRARMRLACVESVAGRSWRDAARRFLDATG